MLWSHKLEPNASHIGSKQMTKKVIKDLQKRSAENSELKQEDLDKVTGGLGEIGGTPTKGEDETYLE